MTHEEMVKAIREAATNQQLSCERAHDLSGSLGVSLKEIGKICNELNVKISACRLGCF